MVVPGRGANVALPALLRRLATRGVVSVLIEGGGELAAAALRARIVDRLLARLGADRHRRGRPADARRARADAPRRGAADRRRARDTTRARPAPRRHGGILMGRGYSAARRMLSPIEEILADVRAGSMVALIDEREGGDGVLCMAAERVTPEAINFMATHARGLICLGLTEGRMRRLGIPLLGNPLAPTRQPAFGASIEARSGVTTGISAGDRARTDPRDRRRRHGARGSRDARARVSDPGRAGRRARPQAPPRRVGRPHAPGRHAAGGGLLHGALRGRLGRDARRHRAPRRRARSPHDDARRARRTPLRSELLVERAVESDFTTANGGRYRAIVYRNGVDRHEHMALVKGTLRPTDVPLVRVHSQCLTGRRLPVGTLRLRRAARPGASHHRVARPRRGRVHAPGGPRHRPRQQDPRLRAAGSGARHGRGQPRARLRGGPARLRHQRADPARPRAPARAAAHQQPAQGRSACRATASRSPSACRSRSRRGAATSRTSGPSKRSSGTC